MKEKWVPTPFAQFPAKSMVIAEPYGVVLIIAPWNYPFLHLFFSHLLMQFQEETVA